MRTINKTLTLLAIMSMTVLVSVQAVAPQWGAAAAKADSNLSVDDMLIYAIQDEFAAQAEYIAIQAMFGEMRPFSNIEQSEQSHIGWLTEQFAAYRKPLPANTAKDHVVTPDTLKRAYEIGVQAEIDNIAMYDAFLATPLMTQAANKALRDVFVRLRDASKNHLSSFQRQLGKY